MNAVERKVRDIIADILYVYPEECKPTAKIVGDLGGESVDFYDIVFRLEHAFPVKILQSYPIVPSVDTTVGDFIRLIEG